MYVMAILKSKGDRLETISPDSTAHDAVQKLRGRGIGSLIVSRDGKTVDGIISERDILRGLAEQGGSILERKVNELMTRDVITCRPEDDADRLMSLMTENRIRHVPVLSGDDLIGVISIGDVVKAALTEMRAEAESMRSYIAAGV